MEVKDFKMLDSFHCCSPKIQLQVLSVGTLRPLIVSFIIVPLPLLEPLLCVDLFFYFFRYVSNPIKTLFAINLVVRGALPGVVFVVGRYGAFGIDIYRLAIL